MKLIFVVFYLIFFSAQSANTQAITSQELSKLSAEINALQTAANGSTLFDPVKNNMSVISFPKESFKVFFSSGFAYQAVYKNSGTDQLFVTENVDLSVANKVTVLPGNSKSSVQCIQVSFPETVVTHILKNGKEVSTIYENAIDFYCTNGNTENKNKLKTLLETLIGKLAKERTKYHALTHGKLYLPDGIYEGGYTAGNRRTNKGTMEYTNEPLYKGVWIYTGYWKNDRRHGEGIIKSKPYKTGDVVPANGGIMEEIYSGTWENDLLQGTGKYEKVGDWKYEGNFVDGKMEGKGTSIDRNGTKYAGDWKNGVKEGNGTYGGYTGEWKNGYKEGKGIYVASNYTEDGEWKNGWLHGYAIYKNDNGERYEGYWVENSKEGKGTFTYKNGEKYVGDWKKGDKDGFGVYTWPNGERYEGNWVKNLKSGKGTLTYQNGEKFIGEWRGDKRNGNGILYDKNNNIIQKGQWRADSYYNPIKPVPLYANDIMAKHTIINADTNYLICYSIIKDSVNFYFYTPGPLQPTIYFDVNNNNKVDTLVDRFTRNFRNQLQSFYILGGVAPTKRKWYYENDLVVITYPISEISQSNVIAFQVAYKQYDTDDNKSLFIPARKEEKDFKKKRLFYITIPQ
ncbi:MORN repeat-containing protein [Ferruginibacter sp.]|nr:hypothetical protein [Ferruginibacter sp.]